MPIFEPDSDTVTGPAIPGAPEEEVLRGDEIQGGVLPGFGTSFQHLFALRFADADALRAFLASRHAAVSTLYEVLEQRNLRRTALRRDRQRPPTPVMRALALSMPGLQLVTPDAAQLNDTPFKRGMKARSPFLGDSKDPAVPGHPSTWLFGGTASTVPHVVVILAAERPGDLDEPAGGLRDTVGAAGIVWEQRGAVLPGEKEHFGFRDGISQIGVRGRLSELPQHFLTRRWFDPTDPRALEYARPGQPLVWPGQFVFGYHRGDPLKALLPGEVKTGGAPWTQDGSLLVLRRLRQDVAAFHDFSAAETARIAALPGFGALSAATLEAKIVGRWPDGSALTRVPDGPTKLESSDMLRTNAFLYSPEWGAAKVCADPQVGTEPLGAAPLGELRTVPGADADIAGLRCPHFAHIRKVNPRGRSTEQGGPLKTRQFQMLRRGITWGSEYSSAGPGDNGDRGLLFMSYQASIDNQFEKLTKLWMNHEDPPESPSGYDLLVGQDNDRPGRSAVLSSDDPAYPNATAALSTAGHGPWIIPTGGEYLFAPSRSVLAQFARS